MASGVSLGDRARCIDTRRVRRDFLIESVLQDPAAHALGAGVELTELSRVHVLHAEPSVRARERLLQRIVRRWRRRRRAYRQSGLIL